LIGGIKMQEYTDWLKNKGYSDNTIRKYLLVYRMFKSYYEITTKHSFEPNLITAIDINDWKKHLQNEAKTRKGKPLSIKTVINYVESIKTYFTYLNKTNLTHVNVADDVKSQKFKDMQQPKWLDRKQKSILLNYIDDPRLKEKNEWRYYRNLAICLTLLMAGLRISEAAALNIWDIEKDCLMIRNGKGGKARIVPMNKDLIAVMDNWLRVRSAKIEKSEEALFTSQKGGRITVSTIRQLIDKIRTETSLKDLTPHVLRHTFCYDLAEQGVKDRIIADLAGHEDINTTRIYTKAAKTSLVDSVNLISTGRYKG